MAVQAEARKGSIILGYSYNDTNGEVRKKRKTIGNLNENATDENIYKAGKALGGLMDNQVDVISKIREHQLIELL